MVEITSYMDDAEFWSDILGSSWYQYPWWEEIAYLDKASWDKVGKLRVKVNFDGVKESATIGLPELVEAYEELRRKGVITGIANVGCAAGDMILQQAVLGEVMFHKDKKHNI